MLKITKKTDYGLTLMAALAKNPEKLMSLRSISSQYHLPYKFIGQVATDLLEAGLIISKEGASGGYRLARLPEEISLYQVMSVLDGPVIKVDCLRGKNCPRNGVCGHQRVLEAVSNSMIESLTNKTVADLVH